MSFPHRIIASSVLVGALLVAAAPAGAAQANAAPRHSARGHLAAKLAKLFRHKDGGRITYSINDSSYGAFTRDPTYQSQPASNQKYFTTITLLDEVGADFHYATTVSATKRVRNHTLNGDLVLRASGDPTLTKLDLLNMAKTLHKHGLHHVTGNLIVDDHRYSHRTYVSGWKHKFIPEETGPIDAFSVDHNVWKHNKTFDADPTHANAKLFRHYLRKRHITIKKQIEVRHAPRTPQRLLTHESQSLASIIDATMTDSINFDAEMMLREAGAQRYGHGSPKTGVAAEHAVASKLGLPFGTAHDGSGLSYTGRSSPAIVEAWLLKLRTLPYFTTEYYSLPLSCRSGTLRYRLCGKSVAGEVRAKTGTLNHASTLSGYVTSQSGHTITFSFFASGVQNFGRVYTKVDKAIALFRRSG